MQFNDIYTTGTVNNNNGILSIAGKIHEHVDNKKIKYLAAAPPYRNSSFSGSGLPYFSKEQAFTNTPNTGEIELDFENNFIIKISLPNAYYESLDSPIIKPQILLLFKSNNVDRTIKIPLGNRIAYRDIKYYCSETACRKDVKFYNIPAQPVRSQEQIILDSRYTNEVQDKFWGKRPIMF